MKIANYVSCYQLSQMDVDPSSPFPESVDEARSSSPAMETDETPAGTTPHAAAPIQNVLAPRNANSEDGPLTPAQIQVGL